MNYILPTLYLTLISSVLIILIVFLVRQIIQKKEVEDSFTELQIKMRNKTATSLDYYSLGVIYLSKKLFDQAILQFRYALKTWDQEDLMGLASLYNTIGFTYFETKQYELSIYYYSEAIRLIPNYSIALNNLAYAYEKNQMQNQAIEIYRQVLKYDKENEIALEKLDKLNRLQITRDDRI
jgi:tetratricopeptide (TPR) repeat protein